jgi:hypothetical protein
LHVNEKTGKAEDGALVRVGNIYLRGSSSASALGEQSAS